MKRTFFGKDVDRVRCVHVDGASVYFFVNFIFLRFPLQLFFNFGFHAVLLVPIITSLCLHSSHESVHSEVHVSSDGLL